MQITTNEVSVIESSVPSDFSYICSLNLAAKYSYVLLTVHLSIILDNDQLDTQLLYFTIRLL